MKDNFKFRGFFIVYLILASIALVVIGVRSLWRMVAKS